jgi:hypothetical protein
MKPTFATLIALCTLLAACAGEPEVVIIEITSTPQASLLTQSAAAVLTNTAAPRDLATRLANITSTAEVRYLALTQAVENARPIVEDLVISGHLISSEGIFEPLSDYNNSYNTRDWFYRFATGESPTDFVWHAVIRQDSTEANASTVAGCGFSFRKLNTNTGNYFLVDFERGLRYGIIDPEYWVPHGRRADAVDDPARGVEVLLAVQGRRYTVFVEGNEILSQPTASEEGAVQYLIAAGSTLMRCSYEDMWLWVLDT